MSGGYSLAYFEQIVLYQHRCNPNHNIVMCDVSCDITYIFSCGLVLEVTCVGCAHISLV